MDHEKLRRAERAEGPIVPDPKAEKGPVPPEDADASEEPASEEPEDYSDPICVCEPEPYWQEVAERLERESRSPK